MMALRMIVVFGAIALSGAAFASSVEAEIVKQAKRVVLQSKDGEIEYKSIEQTLASPIVSYLVKFRVNGSELMTSDKARPGDVAYYANLGITKTWGRRFCDHQMKQLAMRWRIVVYGALIDRDGKSHSSAACAYFGD